MREVGSFANNILHDMVLFQKSLELCCVGGFPLRLLIL
jgi:hypothetical protein